MAEPGPGRTPEPGPGPEPEPEPGPTGAGLSAYGSPLRSADAHSSPAILAALGPSVPPATIVIRQNPVDWPHCSSACRSLSRRAWAARSGNRSADPSAIRCRSPTSSDSARSSAAVTGSAVTSQPNGPVQLPSSPSSIDSPDRPGAPAAPTPPAPTCSPGSASRPSLIPAISRQQASCPSAPASSAGGSARPRAPPGSASSTSPSPGSALPTSASPAARIRTGPPAAARTQPKATGPAGFAIPAW